MKSYTPLNTDIKEGIVLTHTDRERERERESERGKTNINKLVYYFKYNINIIIAPFFVVIKQHIYRKTNSINRNTQKKRYRYT